MILNKTGRPSNSLLATFPIVEPSEELDLEIHRFYNIMRRRSKKCDPRKSEFDYIFDLGDNDEDKDKEEEDQYESLES